MHTRGFPAFVMVVIASTLLGGCGGSSGGSKEHNAASPSATSTSLSAAKAKTLAAAGVLTEADLPGYTAKPQTHDASDDASDALMQRCLGLSKQSYLARNFGTAFTKGTDEIDSSADVASSPDEAHAELQAIGSSKAPGCFKQVLTKLMASNALTVKSITTTKAQATVQGSDGSFGYLLDMTATTRGQTVRLQGYEVGALVGQVEIDVTSIAVGGAGGVTLSQVLSLAGIAAKRVRSAA